MAIAASGAVSLSDLRTEFVGGSSAISLNDLYRGGSNILAKAGDNPATNLAASVPASGVIDVQDFYSTAKGFKNTVSSSTTNIDANALFGDDYDVNYPKIIDINSGVTVGGSSDEAVDIPSGLAGTLVINNAGNILGFGGAANGGAGGAAINCASSGVTINNSGLLAGGDGGGGAGGSGGSGGNGSYTSTSSSTSTRAGHATGYPGNIVATNCWMWTKANWSGVGTFTYSGGSTSTSYAGHSFSRGSYIGSWYDNSYWRIVGTINTTVTNSSSGGSGGSGGAGGVGQGYNQSAASGAGGSGGASGGTSAGSGGTGGTGGAGSAYATAGGTGSTGSTGANGNASNGSGGSGGSSGGAAGAAVTGTSVTMNNTGTLHGAVA